MLKGFFIVFEGIDGAGLTTHARKLEEKLSKKGYRVVLTKEPTDGLIGGLIRASLRGEWKTDPRTLQLLFAADRSHHVRHYILPALREGKIVICDRYMFSSLAYGAVECDYEWLKKINSAFPLPDVTILLDLHPSVALSRIAATRFSFELFENSHRLFKVRENYLRIAKEFDNVFIVNSNRPIEEVHRDIVKIVSDVTSLEI